MLEIPRCLVPIHWAALPSSHPTSVGGIFRLQTQRDGGGRTRHYFRLCADSRKPSRVVFIWVTFTNPPLAFGGWKLLFLPLSTCLYVPAEGLSTDSSAAICGERRAQPWGCAPGNCRWPLRGSRSTSKYLSAIRPQNSQGTLTQKNHSHSVTEVQLLDASSCLLWGKQGDAQTCLRGAQRHPAGDPGQEPPLRCCC